MAVHERMARWMAALAAGLIVLSAVHAGLLLDDAAGDATRTRMYRGARLAATVLRSARAWDDPAMLESTAAEIAQAGAVVLRLYSPEGSLLLDSDRRRASPGPPAPPDAQARVLQRGWESTVQPDPIGGGRELSVAVVVVDEGQVRGVLRLLGPYPGRMDHHSALRGFAVGLWVLAAAAAVLLGAAAAGMLDEPIRRICVVARRLRDGDLAARIEPLPDGDLRQLAADLNGAVDRMVGQVETFRNESRYYEAVLEQMSDAVVVVNEQARIRFVNRAFSKLMNVAAGDVVDHHVEAIGLSYDTATLLVRALEQRTAQRDRILLRSGADTRTIIGVAAALHSAEGAVTGAVGLYHDITDLQRADQVRRDFVSNASHELRTPAAGIKALAEALQAGALQDPVKGPRFVDRIVETSERLGNILDDMLTLTRVERGEELLHPEPVNVAAAFSEALLQVQLAGAGRGITLERECAPDDIVFADARSVQTVLVNLLDNAVKYTPPGGRVRLVGTSVPGGYEMTVSDTGVGIPEEDLSRIFERFYRVDKARDRATGGTGLGLAIVKHIVEAHGGRVTVQSRLDEGSTFRVYLPTAVAPQA
ncbi:MAG TPA: hypothetical protein DGT21_21665 [Armatimonadetes bacterium]|nr:hypothetical protein [Armatimonadota bacterium]